MEQQTSKNLRIIEEPSITIVSAPDFYTGGLPEWKRTEGTDGDYLVEFSGRVCYQSFGTAQFTPTTEKYIQNLRDQQHWSVFEHANFSLYIRGVSRSLTHELIRHRHFSYSQQSQRYVDESSCAFVKPVDLKEGTEAYAFWVEAMWQAQQNYLHLADTIAPSAPAEMSKRDKRIWARQQARSVLPNATATELVVTGNVRAWRHFLLMRGTKFAEPEIRRLAVHTARLLESFQPALFGDYVIFDDGTIRGVGEQS